MYVDSNSAEQVRNLFFVDRLDQYTFIKETKATIIMMLLPGMLLDHSHTTVDQWHHGHDQIWSIPVTASEESDFSHSLTASAKTASKAALGVEVDAVDVGALLREDPLVAPRQVDARVDAGGAVVVCPVGRRVRRGHVRDLVAQGRGVEVDVRAAILEVVDHF